MFFLRPWERSWGRDVNGVSGARICYFLVCYGSEVIELKPGMTAIAVNKRDDLPDAIRSIIGAIRQGELDIQIEDVAERSTAELRLKGVGRQIKRAG